MMVRDAAYAAPHHERNSAPLTLSPVELELKVLSTFLERKLETVADVNLALGKLGGHLNRTSDGPPGMLALWRGTIKLQTLVEGYRIGVFTGRKKFG